MILEKSQSVRKTFKFICGISQNILAYKETVEPRYAFLWALVFLHRRKLTEDLSHEHMRYFQPYHNGSCIPFYVFSSASASKIQF